MGGEREKGAEGLFFMLKSHFHSVFILSFSFLIVYCQWNHWNCDEIQAIKMYGKDELD